MAATRTAKSTKRSGATFSDAEKQAMKDRAAEKKAEKAQAKREDGEKAVRDKIAEMPDDDAELASRLHEIITSAAPDLVPRTWYGMPAYAKDGDVLCFFQPASKFGARYGTLGFNDKAALDSGALWPTAFAVTKLTASGEKEIRALVRRAAG